MTTATAATTAHAEPPDWWLDAFNERPESSPIWLSADGKRYMAMVIAKKHRCDPEDEYDAGYCDWTIKAEFRQVADRKLVETVKLKWAGYKADAAGGRTLFDRLKREKYRKGDKVEQGDRFYKLAGGYRVVIDGHRRKVRLRVLGPRGKELVTETVKGRCKARGAKTIWGADVFWFKVGRVVFVRNPRACKTKSLAVFKL